LTHWGEYPQADASGKTEGRLRAAPLESSSALAAAGRLPHLRERIVDRESVRLLHRRELGERLRELRGGRLRPTSASSADSTRNMLAGALM